MKKSVTKEEIVCDNCGEECYEACLGCGVNHCWECQKTHGKEYTHAVNFSGTGDGYYCHKCDDTLINDELHIAYKAIETLKKSASAYYAEHKKKSDAAEVRLELLRGKAVQEALGYPRS